MPTKRPTAKAEHSFDKRGCRGARGFRRVLRAYDGLATNREDGDREFSNVGVSLDFTPEAHSRELSGDTFGYGMKMRLIGGPEVEMGGKRAAAGQSRWGESFLRFS